MAKSVKLQNDTYIDSTGIVHNRKLLSQIINEIGLITHPVGSIYITIDGTNPASIFGGTWVQIKDVFLLACGNHYPQGATGGEASHQLTASEMPFSGMVGVDSGDTSALWCIGEIKNYPAGTYKITRQNIAKGSHNNMPPYFAVYMWQRTA